MNDFKDSTKSILISVFTGIKNDESVKELSELCKTLGFAILKIFVQKRNRIDTNYYVGKGKIQSIKECVINNKVNVAVFDGSLSNDQRKNIEKILKINILDRNEVILEIFKLHAKTSQSKLQVELARLNYELPKLIGKGKQLSRTGGGIGTLGPGETMLESNRRIIRKRISFLKKRLKKIEKSQDLLLKRKSFNDSLKISLVGYTSAGKSTFLKSLTDDSNIVVSKNLFSTLSTLSRRVALPSGLNVVFSDTVGFIKNLPIQLIESFKSTLMHINYSDLLLIIVDLSNDDYESKLRSVRLTLQDILSVDIPKLVVFNKIDKVERSKLTMVKSLYPNAYFLSAVSYDEVHNFLYFLERYMIHQNIVLQHTVILNNQNLLTLNRFKGRIGILNNDNSKFVKVIGKSSNILTLKHRLH